MFGKCGGVVAIKPCTAGLGYQGDSCVPVVGLILVAGFALAADAGWLEIGEFVTGND